MKFALFFTRTCHLGIDWAAGKKLTPSNTFPLQYIYIRGPDRSRCF